MSNRNVRRQRNNEQSLPVENLHLRDYQLVWQWLHSKHRWFDQSGLRGWFAWQYTVFFRWLARQVTSRRVKDRYGFAIPNDAALKRLSQFPRLIEIGAGKGYWAHLLRARGVDILAYDKYPVPGEEGSWHTAGSENWTEVLAGDASVLPSHPERVLFLCYPDKSNTMASDALTAYAGEILAYVATSQAIAVGDDLFHWKLDREWDLVEAIPIPAWLDFFYHSKNVVPIGARWGQVSRIDRNYGDNLFIFRRK